MRQKIETVKVQAEPIRSFDRRVQAMFDLMCQYIDELFRRAGVPHTFLPRTGSASWVPADPPGQVPVVVKAVPWDHRTNFRELAQYCPDDTPGGTAVLVRNEYLTAPDMQMLWKEFGRAYHACPSSERLYAARPADDSLFQLILFSLGPGCSLLELPGTDLAAVPERLRRHEKSTRNQQDEESEQIRGRGDGEDHGLLREIDEAIQDALRGRPVDLDHDRLAGALGGLCRRATTPPGARVA